MISYCLRHGLFVIGALVVGGHKILVVVIGKYNFTYGSINALSGDFYFIFDAVSGPVQIVDFLVNLCAF